MRHGINEHGGIRTLNKLELNAEEYREIANVLLRSALALKCPQLSDLNEIASARHNIEWAKNILWDGLPFRPNNWEVVAEAQAIAGEQLLTEIEKLRETLKSAEEENKSLKETIKKLESKLNKLTITEEDIKYTVSFYNKQLKRLDQLLEEILDVHDCSDIVRELIVDYYEE